MTHQQPGIFNAETRRALQGKGQFWTPQWVARAMVRYPISHGARSLFDPALGAGAFFQAARAVAGETGTRVALKGCELHPETLDEAREAGVREADLARVHIGDFMAYEFAAPEPAIVANPPYLRHHKIGPRKAEIQAMATAALGRSIDGRAGLHVYFLIKCLSNLAPGGRLAFIMPADSCEGVFAPTLWRWVTERFRLSAVVTFTPEATPFPGVDTNAVIVFIEHAPPTEHFVWAQWRSPDESLEQWVAGGFPATDSPSGVARVRTVAEGVATGLSRVEDTRDAGRPLGDFARVVRGIATGDNDFFFLTGEQVRALGLPATDLVRAVGRTRDLSSDTVTTRDLARLDAAGRPTYLLYLDDTPMTHLDQTTRAYLETGIERGVHQGTLVATRGCWYKMERREVPPFLFAYLGRSDVRFIKNTAGVRPLTGFLCVYPKDRSRAGLRALWSALNDPRTLANLVKVGKSYGGGAIKVEPRALDRLLIPQAVLDETGLA